MPDFVVAHGLDDGPASKIFGRQLFEMVLAVASGEKTKSERAGMGDEEFAPWMIGPTF